MTQIQLALANENDDLSLRRLLRQNVMDGHFGVSFRREPSYFTAAATQGKTYEIIKGTDTTTKALVGLAGRFTYPAYLNGEPTTLGYLAELRIAPEYRNGLSLARGFRFLRQLHQQSPVPCYTTMILDGNQKAFDSLTTERAGLPKYTPQGRILTPAIHLDRAKKALFLPHVSIEKAHNGNIDKVFNFINQQRKQQQFAPHYTVADLASPRLRGLSADDFYIAVKDNNIIGVIAAWEQTAFRQVHLERYSPTLKMVKPFYNLLSRLTPLKALPAEGEKIPYFYLAFIAIKNNDCAVFRLLLNALYRERYRGAWHYFICGLHENDALASVLNDYRRINSHGHLYSVSLGDEVVLDNRLPFVEIATI